MSVKLLLYCTKAKQKIRVTEHLYMYDDDLYKLPNGKIKFGNSFELSLYDGQYSKDNFLNGKIVAECECEKVEEIICSKIFNGVGFDVIYDTCELLENKLYKKSCLDYYHFGDYFGEKDNEPVGYALHLSNVKVFDEPKELKDYSVNNPLFENIEMFGWMFEDVAHYIPLTKAPQNMCNVYDNQGNHYILISIRPEHLCKILNGEKTIEIRKKILNSLKEVL